jgi:2-dehydropantoate 2-reductase
MPGAGPFIFMGAGAVGSYVGGMLSAAGHDVILIDAWPGHIEAVRANGLIIETPEATIEARPRALHICDVHQLVGQPASVAFLCVKLYDTSWAATLLDAIVPTAPIVTMQNALVEEEVARIVGWGRTLGAIGGTLDVALMTPGRVRRARRRGAASPVFKIGELSGRKTPRVQAIADLLAEVDTTSVTSHLWDDRWAKLVANTMTTGLSAIGGLTFLEVYRRDDTRRLAVALAAEAFAVGRQLGFGLHSVFGVSPQRWQAAHAGDPDADAEAMSAMAAQSSSMVEGGVSGTLQDLTKRRRTEVDYFNGYIAKQGRACDVDAPTDAWRRDRLIRPQVICPVCSPAVERGEPDLAGSVPARPARKRPDDLLDHLLERPSYRNP